MNVLGSWVACGKCLVVAIGTNIYPLHIVLTVLQCVLMTFGHADILIIATKTHHWIKVLVYTVLDLALMTYVPLCPHRISLCLHTLLSTWDPLWGWCWLGLQCEDLNPRTSLGASKSGPGFSWNCLFFPWYQLIHIFWNVSIISLPV